MSTLMQASRQWSTRPAEERFISLTEMHAQQAAQRAISRAAVVSSRQLRAVPTDDNSGILIEGPNGHGFAPSHWAFGQAAGLIGAPAGYLRCVVQPDKTITKAMKMNVELFKRVTVHHLTYQIIFT